MADVSSKEWMALLQWVKGDKDAADMIALLGRVCQDADDVVDEQKPERMAEVLADAMVRLPSNAFYQKHSGHLLGVFLCSIMQWDASEDWRRSPNETTRMFAFVLRSSLEQVIILCAYLVGGFDHARKVTREVHEFYRDPNETFHDWEQEKCV